MKNLIVLLTCWVMVSCNSSKPDPENKSTDMKNTSETTRSFYDLSFQDINGNNFDFDQLKGKKVLIVNTASECGYTPQYAQLQELYQNFGGEKFEIIGFPANNFGQQEPGTDENIQSFCQKNYGVTFPLMTKSDVIGENQNTVYAWLTHEAENHVADAEVKWNFHKFLIDENGQWIASYPSSVTPLDEQVMNFVNAE